MAYQNVPGLKKSTGQKEFTPCSVGNGYKAVIENCKIEAPKDNSPQDVYVFQMSILSGPQQEDGTMPKSKKHWARVYIKKEDHPEYTDEQMGVDELKSIIVAAGVELKGDKFNPDSFAGQEIGFDITASTSKKNGKVYTNTRNWKAL